MRHFTLSVLACASVLLGALALPQTVAAQTAIGEPVGDGNQNYADSLGIDFTVNSSLTITGLGAYNNTGNNFLSTKTVEIWNIDATPTLVTSLTIGPADTTTLINGFRYKDTGLVLGTGTYTIDAYGFDSFDLNYNTNVSATAVTPTLNTFGGAVTWVQNGTGAVRNRYGTGGVGTYPTNVNDGANWYLANGSFQASAPASTPEPGSIALLVGMGLSGAGFLTRRRRSANKVA